MKKFIIIIVPVVLAVFLLSSCAGGKQVKATSSALTPVTQDTLVSLGFTPKNIKGSLYVSLSSDLKGQRQNIDGDGVETSVVDGVVQVRRKPNLTIKSSSLGEVISWDKDAGSITVVFQDEEDLSLLYQVQFVFNNEEDKFHPQVADQRNVQGDIVYVKLGGAWFAFDLETWKNTSLNFRLEEIPGEKDRETGDRQVVGEKKL